MIKTTSAALLSLVLTFGGAAVFADSHMGKDAVHESSIKTA
ncbi:hypothetical protein [Thiorhodococcus mannitoliphagus]|nr:hypothetical protein [Thiorhodococcus mannitoliphagus]